jgi:hypothetical protein
MIQELMKIAGSIIVIKVNPEVLFGISICTNELPKLPELSFAINLKAIKLPLYSSKEVSNTK